MMHQGKLFPDKPPEDDAEYLAHRNAVIDHVPELANYGEEVQKFVVYCLVFPSVSVPKIAKMAGTGKTRAYELRKSTEVMDLLQKGAAAMIDAGDIKGMLTVAKQVEIMHEMTFNGDLKPKDITPTMYRMLEASVNRHGLITIGVSRTTVAPDGSSKTVGVAGNQKRITELLEATRRNAETPGEAESPEDVRFNPDSLRNLEDLAGQKLEKSAQKLPNAAALPASGNPSEESEHLEPAK